MMILVWERTQSLDTKLLEEPSKLRETGPLPNISNVDEPLRISTVGKLEG
jgi:hypothetical protein